MKSREFDRAYKEISRLGPYYAFELFVKVFDLKELLISLKSRPTEKVQAEIKLESKPQTQLASFNETQNVSDSIQFWRTNLGKLQLVQLTSNSYDRPIPSELITGYLDNLPFNPSYSEVDVQSDRHALIPEGVELVERKSACRRQNIS